MQHAQLPVDFLWSQLTVDFFVARMVQAKMRCVSYGSGWRMRQIGTSWVIREVRKVMTTRMAVKMHSCTLHKRLPHPLLSAPASRCLRVSVLG